MLCNLVVNDKKIVESTDLKCKTVFDITGPSAHTTSLYSDAQTQLYILKIQH